MCIRDSLRACGEPFIAHFCGLLQHISQAGEVPCQWKGGRIARLWKKKGGPADCANSRGILIGTAMSKLFTAAMEPSFAPLVDAALPAEQAGCRSGRGASRPAHVSRAHLHRNALKGRSAGVLFLDLVKAFDKVVRETLFGVQCGDAEATAHLTELGLPPPVATTLTDYIMSSGGLLAELRVPVRVQRLVAELHNGTWFTLSAGGKIITTQAGVRQGCRYGALLFNLSLIHI